MSALSSLSGLRDLAARRLVHPTDTLIVCIRRDGLTVFRWTLPASELDLWDDEFPEADTDGIPTHPQHKAVLLELLKGPKIVERLAQALGLSSASRLYEGPGALAHLKEMDLVVVGDAGYALTPKGRRVAKALTEAEG